MKPPERLNERIVANGQPPVLAVLLRGLLLVAAYAPSRAGESQDRKAAKENVMVVHPSPLEQKALVLESPGKPPAGVILVVPTITRPGEPFDAKVALADRLGCPVTTFDGAVAVRGASAPASARVEFKAGSPAVALVRGLRIDVEGFHRLSVEFQGKTVHSNPTLCSRKPAGQIVWGDPHVHTVLSNCHPDKGRSLQFCYAAARWFAGLDWVAASDHISNGRGDLSKWKEQVAASNLYDDAPAFVTLPAYEASLQGGAGGDNNVYMLRWPDLFVDEHDHGTVKTLCQRLAAKLKGAEEFFVAPHHTTRRDKHGEIPDGVYPGPRLMPVIEIHSKWGTSEYRGNPHPLHDIHEGPSYTVDLLNRGLRLGFIGGTDAHSTMPAGFGNDVPHLDRLPGMTAVRVGELSRANVFHGIAGRDCYATSLERIYLDVTVAGAGMGQLVRAKDITGPLRVTATAAGQSDITEIDVVRNGRTIHSQPVGDWHGSLKLEDAGNIRDHMMDSKHLGRFEYYYVRVTCASGAQAWSSPVFVIDDCRLDCRARRWHP